MVTKMKKSSKADSPSESKPEAGSGTSKSSQPQLSGTVKESAQQIWLAGLGAFAKAQEEGGKVFEALVKEGTSIQRKTQAAAEERISEATSRMASMATDISSKASGQWDKLETIFEQRVSKALDNLGVPSAKEVGLLMERIDELERRIARLGATSTGGAGRTAGRTANQPARSTPKPAAKRSSARKSA